MPKLKILIDECLDRRFAKEISHAYVKTTQQNLPKYQIIVIVMCPVRNQLEDLKLLVPSLFKVLSGPMNKQLIHVR